MIKKWKIILFLTGSILAIVPIIILLIIESYSLKTRYIVMTLTLIGIIIIDSVQFWIKEDVIIVNGMEYKSEK